MTDVAVPFAMRRVVKTVWVEVSVLRLETVATIEVEMLKLDVFLLAAFPFPMFPVPYGMEYADEELLALDVTSAAASTLLDDEVISAATSTLLEDEVISAATSTLLDEGLPYSKLGYSLVSFLRLRWG